MYSKILLLSLLYFVAFSNASRVIYMIMHAEKPGNGDLKKGQRWSSTQNIPGEYDNGLSYTGFERSKCLVDVFGRNAPSYRQPKAILYQHYEKQGDYIDSGERGKHQSRRMYETASLLAQDLGINLDEQKCCGGDPSDMFQYIEAMDESINPILIVHQHQQIYQIAKKYAKKFGKTLPYSEFAYSSSTIWTLVDGEVIEDWNMGCYFDKPTKQDKLADNIDQYINGNTLIQTNGGNTNLVQEVTPLITTKVVPASLLTTITSKVPPTGVAATAVADQPKELEGSKTIQITILPTPVGEGQTTTKTTKTVPDINNNGGETLPGKSLPGKSLPGNGNIKNSETPEIPVEVNPEGAETPAETPKDKGAIPKIVIPEVNLPVNVAGGSNNNNNNKNNNNNNNKNNNNNNNNNNNKNNNNNNNNPWGGNNNNNNNPWGGNNNNNNNNNKNNNKDPWAEVFGNNNNNDPWAEIFGNNNKNNNNNNNNNNKNNNNNNNWWNPWNWNNNNNNNNNKNPFWNDNNNKNDNNNWFQKIIKFFKF